MKFQTLRERELFPHRNAARLRTRRLINRGVIQRKPCEVCGRTDFVHAHHPDYFEPENVMFLCPVHHKAWHMENEVIG